MVQKTKAKTRLFLVMIMFFWMSIYTYQPQLSVYCGLLGAGSAFTGTILSSYGFVQIFLRVPIGLLSDRICKRKLFVILGGVSATISAFGLYFAPSPFWLLIFRGAAGVAASAWVTFTVLYSSYFNDEEATKAMPGLLMFNNIGLLLGMLSGGLISQLVETRASFLLAGFIAMLSTVLSVGITENVPAVSGTVSVKELVKVFGNKTLLSVSFVALLGQCVHHGTSFGFNPKFAAEMGATPLQLSFLSAAMAAGTVTGSWLVSHFLMKRFGLRKCILSGPIIYGLGTILMPILSKNVIILIGMQFIVGMGNGINFPLLMGTAIAEIEQKRRGLAMGIFQSIYAMGMFVGPLITGALIDYLSIGRTISFVGCIAIIEFTAGLFLIPKKN